MNYVQGNFKVNLSGPTPVTISYLGPNTAGNMGICSIFQQGGVIPASITSAVGNTWCLVNTNQVGSGVSQGTFVCWSMAPATESVTVGYATNISVTFVREYSFSSPAYFIALQPNNVSAILPYTEGSQGIVYAPLSIATPVTAYYNPQSGGVQQSVTVTVFVDIFDQASFHDWFPHAGGTVRQSANYSDFSAACGENTVSSGGTQTEFICQFEPYWITTPVTPQTQVCSFMVVEA
jgi:hypothetical protein